MQRFTTSDGLSLAFDDEGTGIPVLCLAGLTRTRHDFEELGGWLTGCRLIRMDYRGRGDSDWAKDPAEYAPPIEARDAVELLDHLGLDRAAIIGTSRGGLIAMTLAALVKDRLTGVLLNDVGPVLELAAIQVIRNYVGKNPAYRSYDEAVQHYPATLVGFANVPEARWQTEVRRLWTETPNGLVIRYDPALSVGVSAAADAPLPDLWPLFDMMDGLPLALLRGANSPLLSVETAAEMCRRRPDMLFSEVADRGHVPMLDEVESRDIITRWLGMLA